MSNFTRDFEEFIKSKNLNVYRFAEIKDGGEVEEVTLSNCNPCQNSYSVAKLFVTSAIGFLYDEKKVALDDRLCDILGDDWPENANEKFKVCTVEMALRHSLGLPVCMLDIDCFDSRTFGEDYLEFVFKEPPTYEPGTQSLYTDAAFYVLSRVVEKITGESTDNYLWKKLFYPLEFREVAWSHCPKGHVIGATGLYIYASDMVKLGEIYLNKGTYKGKRFLSEEWCNLCYDKPFELYTWDFGQGPIRGKGGMRFQMLMFDPNKKRAVAWHGCDEADDTILLEFISKYEG